MNDELRPFDPSMQFGVNKSTASRAMVEGRMTNDRSVRRRLASTCHLRQRSAFTLIELLVVVLIIGILASTSVLLVGNARLAARDARRKADVKSIATALEAYVALRGSTGPFDQQVAWSSMKKNDSDKTGWECKESERIGWLTWPDLQKKLAVFIQLPYDPMNKITPNRNCGNLAYGIYLGGPITEVWAFLENPSDPDRHAIRRYQTDTVDNDLDCTIPLDKDKGVKYAGWDQENFNKGKYNQIYWYTNTPKECKK